MGGGGESETGGGGGVRAGCEADGDAGRAPPKTSTTRSPTLTLQPPSISKHPAIALAYRIMAFEQSLGEFESNGSAAQGLLRIAAPVLIWIQDRQRGRKCVV